MTPPELPQIKKGLVTTIIPVFNRRKMLKQAVASVLAQSYQSLQIIIVDDGSTDATRKTVKRLAKQHDLVIALRQSNAGPGSARQLGLNHAEGEYIQFLDSDDLLKPNKFTSQVAALKENRKAIAAYGITELLLDDGVNKLVPWKRTGEVFETMFPLFLHERWWGTSTPLYRHVELRKAGPILPLINEEDWEYDCRVAALDGQLAYVDEIVSQQRRHNDHLSTGGTVTKAKLRDRCIARSAMYQSARRSRVKFSEQDMQQFSKSVFLLARQCAVAGLSEQVHEMLRLSIKANKGPSREHQVFIKVGNFVGWRIAGYSAKLWQSIRYK